MNKNDTRRILNFNIGVLGHVDSGKTSLSKGLSTVASTAAFDKNPESKERGITLDLGFSSFTLDPPDHIIELGFDVLQVTLVDCPGHASLIKTIIGGAQIINLMMLVIDVTKGMQTQTAECLVIGQITSDRMIIVLNKTDMIPTEKRQATIDKMKKRLRLTLQSTKFKDSQIIAVSARPGGPDASEDPVGLTELVQTIKDQAYVPVKKSDGNALFAVDHCFSIKGQGTVMTGTVLQGTIKVGDTLEIPSLSIAKKVKSIQMFRKGVASISHGDRAGVCVTQFDPTLLERGLVCSPSSIPISTAVIIDLNCVPYYKGEIRSKTKFHISLGHETVMARVTLFSTCMELEKDDVFDFNSEYQFDEQLQREDELSKKFVLLEFERTVPVIPRCIVIGSKLDTDINANLCRLAFHGKVCWSTSDKEYIKNELQSLKVYKNKNKTGIAERAPNEHEVIVRDLVKKETNVELFAGLKVELSSGEQGTIEGSFGQSGKLKVRVMSGLSADTFAKLGGKKKKGDISSSCAPITVSLKFKKYIFDEKTRIIQN